MENSDLMVAADRALSLLARMSDDELMLALEQCDASLAYAVDCHAGRDMYFFAAANLRLSSEYILDRSLYLLLSEDVINLSLEPLCLSEAMNDSNYALAA